MLGVRFKKLSHKGLITFLLVLSLSPLVLRLALKKSYRFAVVIKTNRVYEGPSKIFQDFGEIHEGSRIIVSRYRDKWYYITSPSSFSGWIEKSALGFY